jgi:hypothetical protein
MRFRRLTTEELFALETEFKQFLIISEQYDEEWRILVKTNPEKAEEFIALFSDLVLEKVYSQLSYLVHFSDSIVSFFDVKNNPLKAYHIKRSDNLPLHDEQVLEEVLEVHYDELSFYIGEKNLVKEKVDEIYDLIRKGSEACEEAYFLKYTEHFTRI